MKHGDIGPGLAPASLRRVTGAGATASGPRRVTGRRRAGAVVLIVGTLFAGAVSASAQARRVTVMQSNYFGPTVRPDALAPDPDSSLHDVAWASWGGPVAVGRGVLTVTEGDSSPPDSPATVTLSRIRSCGPFRMYTRGTISPADQSAFPVNVACHIYAVTDPVDSPSGWQVEERPRRVTLAIEQTAVLGPWTGWGHNVATAHGKVLTEGNLPRRGVSRVQLSRVGFCASRAVLVYTLAHWTWTVDGRRRSGSRDLRHGCVR